MLSLVLTLALSAATEPSARLIEAELAPRSKVRLAEIDRELRTLIDRPSTGELISQTTGKLTPWLLVAGAPLVVLGYLFGNGSHPTLGQVFLGAGAVLGGVLVIGVVLIVFAVIDHWVSEADDAPARDRRIGQLRAEREELFGR